MAERGLKLPGATHGNPRVILLSVYSALWPKAGMRLAHVLPIRWLARCSGAFVDGVIGRCRSRRAFGNAESIQSIPCSPPECSRIQRAWIYPIHDRHEGFRPAPQELGPS